MSERKNPYLILGLDYGASKDEASQAFARTSRRLRRAVDSPYDIADLTEALHHVEQVATDPAAELSVFRVPANPEVFLRGAVERTEVPAIPLARRTRPRPEAWEELKEAVAEDRLRDWIDEQDSFGSLPAYRGVPLDRHPGVDDGPRVVVSAVRPKPARSDAVDAHGSTDHRDQERPKRRRSGARTWLVAGVVGGAIVAGPQVIDALQAGAPNTATEATAAPTATFEAPTPEVAARPPVTSPASRPSRSATQTAPRTVDLAPGCSVPADSYSDDVPPWELRGCRSASVVGDESAFLAIFASLKAGEYELTDAEDVRDTWDGTQILWSTFYPEFTRGLLVVFKGPFKTREAALAACDDGPADCYIAAIGPPPETETAPPESANPESATAASDWDPRFQDLLSEHLDDDVVCDRVAPPDYLFCSGSREWVIHAPDVSTAVILGWTEPTSRSARAVAAMTPAAQQPSGLLCRELQTQGLSSSDAVEYWFRNGRPARMDADGNGIPCETVYPDARSIYFERVITI